MSVATSFGILSTARINEHLLAAARESDQVRFTAVASRDAARAEAYARKHGVERSYGSYDALLDDPTIDAVYISLPNSLHVEWAVRALEAGKHVLCEKPLTRNGAQAERAFDAAERAGRLLVEGFMYRHHPQTKQVQALIDEGAIGRLHAIRSVFGFSWAGAEHRGRPDPRLQAELHGGALMDLGCYCLSGIRLLGGEPQRVVGEHVLSPSGVDMSFSATLSFPGDVTGQLYCSFELPVRQELEALGDEGTIRIEAPFLVGPPWLGFAGEATLRRGDVVEPIRSPEANSYRLELENLSAAIRGEQEPLLGRADAVGQAWAIDALYASAADGVPVELAS